MKKMKQIYCRRLKEQNINLKLSKLICLTIKKLNEEVNEANKLWKNYRPKYKCKIVQIN